MAVCIAPPILPDSASFNKDSSTRRIRNMVRYISLSCWGESTSCLNSFATSEGKIRVFNDTVLVVVGVSMAVVIDCSAGSHSPCCNTQQMATEECALSFLHKIV